MAFQLLNSPKETGDYLFHGQCLVFHKCYRYFSFEEIEDVKDQIRKYARIKSRGYILIFENERGERLCAYDNISQSEISEMRAKRIAEFDIQEMNYYILLPECDRF